MEGGEFIFFWSDSEIMLFLLHHAATDYVNFPNPNVLNGTTLLYKFTSTTSSSSSLLYKFTSVQLQTTSQSLFLLHLSSQSIKIVSQLNPSNDRASILSDSLQCYNVMSWLNVRF